MSIVGVESQPAINQKCSARYGRAFPFTPDSLVYQRKKRTHNVLNDVSVAFEKGTLTSVIGVNGCGKSTLLKTVLGIVSMRSGSVTIDGNALQNMRRKDIARRVAYFSQGKTTPNMTVEQLMLHSRFSRLNYPRHLPLRFRIKCFCCITDKRQAIRNIPIDNSATERAIRPFTIGQANWHIIDTIHGSEASATIYSLVETAKANKLKIYEYLQYLLTKIPKHMDDSSMDFLEDLLPWSEKLPEECHKKI